MIISNEKWIYAENECENFHMEEMNEDYVKIIKIDFILQ